MCASWLFQMLMMFKATIYSDPKLFISGWLRVSAESWTVSSCHISYLYVPAVLVTSMPPTLFTVNFITPSSFLVVYCEVLGPLVLILNVYYHSFMAIIEVIVMYIDWPVASCKKGVADL